MENSVYHRSITIILLVAGHIAHPIQRLISALPGKCRPVKRTRWRAAWLRALAATVGLSAMPVHSAVPPPLGPTATVNTSNTPSFSIEVLRLFVRGRAQEIVDKTNADFSAQGKSARVSVANVTAWSPYRTATQHVDRPNQYIARARFGISLNVNIPWWGDRTIYIPLNIDASCEGWHRSAGQLRFISVPGPASIEGGNFIEEILQVRDLITARVRDGLTPPSSTELPFSGSCATIGVFDDANGNFDAIIWSAPRPALHRHTALQRRIEVTPLALRRLAATRIDTGSPVGDPIENVTLQTYANFHAAETPQMALRDNDQIVLNLPAMVLQGEPTTTLVVIGNLRDTALRTTGTAFRVTTQNANYSPGTHTLQINTEYWVLPLPPLRKPLKITVPTYELTYEVKYVSPLAGSSSSTF